MLAGAEQLREVKRLHDGAGVTATSTTVFPGHDEVRKIAESGTAPAPVPVRHPSSPRRPSDGPRRSPDAGRPAGRHGSYQGRPASSERTFSTERPASAERPAAADRSSAPSERRGGPTGANIDGSRRHQPRRRTPSE
jgi:hypothetical protein